MQRFATLGAVPFSKFQPLSDDDFARLTVDEKVAYLNEALRVLSAFKMARAADLLKAIEDTASSVGETQHKSRTDDPPQ